ncbi:hypothetical protein [Nocardia panacis]|nr:hypothetical protein [Nocardia panacis]
MSEFRVLKAISVAASATPLTLVVPVAIWPGEAELTAPLFCGAPYREPIVVADTTHDSEGTSVNYTLYCATSRGAVTDQGFVLPFLVLMAAHFVLIATAILVGALLSRRRGEPPRIAAPDVVEF